MRITGLIVFVAILSDTCRERSQENVRFANTTTVGGRAIGCINRFAHAAALQETRVNKDDGE